MINRFMRLYEPEFDRIEGVVSDLVRNARARVVFLIDRNGQLIGASGELDEIDTTSLASLTAANMAAAAGLARLLEENQFAAQVHEGEDAHLHTQLVGDGRGILVIVFGDQSSLGLVRLRVSRCVDTLTEIFQSVVQQEIAAGTALRSRRGQPTDEEIEQLFVD